MRLPRGARPKVTRARAWLLGAAFVVACGRSEPGERVEPVRLADLSAPANDVGERCSDLGDARVCFSDTCPDGVCVEPRPLPVALVKRGDEFRCTGSGAARLCSPRLAASSPFACHVNGCIQLEPRLPDDSEWECADLAGIVLCRGGALAAGVPPATPAAGWFCGPRAGKRSAERVCLDLDPDFPIGRRARVTCEFENRGARGVRVCRPGAGSRLGSRCAAREQCPGGAGCRNGFCVPDRLAPSCWGDSDCGVGTCVYGACTQGPP